MFSFNLHSFKAPRAKKTNSKEKIIVPLPIGISDPNDQNVSINIIQLVLIFYLFKNSLKMCQKLFPANIMP